MTAPVDLGIPGLSAALGSHMCVFYRGSPERDQILVPFLREGLRVGDKCVCVVDTIDPGIVLTALALPEIRIAMDNGQLEVHSSLRSSRSTRRQGARGRGPAGGCRPWRTLRALRDL
jgi:hypothetical protein